MDIVIMLLVLAIGFGIGRAKSKSENAFYILMLIMIVASVSGVNGLEIKQTDKPQQIITDLPILITVYDTSLCTSYPCIQGDGDGLFATLIPVSPEWYGKMAACPPELLGSTLVIPYLEMEVYCGDAFGSLNGVPVETVVWGNDGHIKVDVFWPVASEGLPEWNYWHIDGWHYEWR